MNVCKKHLRFLKFQEREFCTKFDLQWSSNIFANNIQSTTGLAEKSVRGLCSARTLVSAKTDIMLPVLVAEVASNQRLFPLKKKSLRVDLSGGFLRRQERGLAPLR